MIHRTPPAITRLSLALALAVLTAACRREPTPVPALPGRPAATLAALPTPEPAATDTPNVLEEARQPPATLLPADPEAVVVQIGHVTHSPWEPAILAQMTPIFSLQAKGFAVFSYQGGPSLDGWYQSMLSEQDTLAFVRLLADEIGVLQLARRPSKPIVFQANRDGSPRGTRDLWIIYVRTAEREGRLVLTGQELTSQATAGRADLAQLADVLAALDRWRSGAATELSPQEEAALAARLHWSSTVRQPYTPERAVALGTRAPTGTPPDAPAAVWPLEVPLAETMDIPFGQEPGEVLLQGEDVVKALRVQQKRKESGWGPLWHDAGRPELYLVGIRPAPPGANHLVVPYTYRPPPNASPPRQKEED